MTLESIYNLGIGLIIVGIIIGLIPAFIAYSRGHSYKHIILILCLFGSWTGILWIVAFIWSVWPSDKSIIDPIAGNVTGTGSRNIGDTIGTVKSGINREAKQEPLIPSIESSQNNQSNKVSVGEDQKICPFCAETIKAAAKLCRFCKSNIDTVSSAEGDQDNDLNHLFNSDFTDEDYLKRNLYKEYSHNDLKYYKLPNKNFVIHWTEKYYVLNGKDSILKCLEQYDTNKTISDDHCIKIIWERYLVELRIKDSENEIERAKKRWNKEI